MFHNHRFLEEELSRRYREAAPATLAVLQERCDAVSSELAAADVRLRAAADVGSLRRAGEALSRSESSRLIARVLCSKAED